MLIPPAIPPHHEWGYRARLEWPDVDITRPLPPGWTLIKGVTSIVNSDGVAVDPQHRLVKRGAALLTPECADPLKLAQEVEGPWHLWRPGHNYRTSLRMLVHVPNLWPNLPVLQRIAAFTENIGGLIEQIDPLGKLTSDQPDRAAHSAAQAYLREVQADRHHIVSPARARQRAQATTWRELVESRPEAVDLRMSNRDWIEFRCFATPLDPMEVHAAASFAGLWLHQAIGGHDPLRASATWGRYLPRQQRFDAELERGWRETNFERNTRTMVRMMLRARGKL